MSVGSAELDVLEEERAVKDVELDGHPLDSGQRRLEELGYKQELRREFGILSSTCAGFASTSFLLTITGAPVHAHSYLLLPLSPPLWTAPTLSSSQPSSRGVMHTLLCRSDPDFCRKALPACQ